MQKDKTNKTTDLTDSNIEVVPENTTSALPVKDVILPGNIGLKKDGHEGMVQVHKSMRKIYEDAGFEIIESTIKKK